jgi:hypothetical protein
MGNGMSPASNLLFQTLQQHLPFDLLQEATRVTLISSILMILAWLVIQKEL